MLPYLGLGYGTWKCGTAFGKWKCTFNVARARTGSKIGQQELKVYTRFRASTVDTIDPGMFGPWLGYGGLGYSG